MISDIFDRRLNSNDVWVKNEGVQGHPFLFEDWSRSNIETIRGSFKEVNVKLNLEKNHVYFQDEKGEVLILNDDYVTSLILKDPEDGSMRKFIKLPLNGYFELILEGEYSLLVKHTKVFIPSISSEGVNTITNKSMNRYTQKSLVSIYFNGQVQIFESNKDFKEYFSTESETSEFIKTNKIKLSDLESMKILVNYLNKASE